MQIGRAQPGELIPGELRKLTVKDPQRYPTLRMPYGEDVAVIHASAGMRRIIALAMLAWIPLLALSIAGGHAWGDSVRLPFLYDVELHLRAATEDDAKDDDEDGWKRQIPEERRAIAQFSSLNGS